MRRSDCKASDFLPKSDVRQLIKISKNQVKKIDHPHARYNQLGRISCIVCGVQIKSEFAWTVHVLSKTHKQNEAKEQSLPLKRLSSDASSHAPVKTSKTNHDVPNSCTVSEASSSHKQAMNETHIIDKSPAEKSREVEPDSKLPEGFFDDKYQDAKARNVPYKDKLTDEVDLFQKELVALEKESEVISERENKAMVTRRELDEIDEQIEKWRKIEELLVEKDTIGANLKSHIKETGSFVVSVKPEQQDTSDSDEINDDELYDFRTKSTL